ncbi:hypothetical protein [Desulfovibrio sp. SGI.169]|uniref:hypothetical protein n=1 Tax=Desulfovibrio sp. SGI.169 TaxID=3420561 RepID=UPI003D06FFE6
MIGIRCIEKRILQHIKRSIIKENNIRFEEYTIYRCPREYVASSCVWVRDGRKRESGQVFGIERELHDNKTKICYVQIREIDKTIPDNILIKVNNTKGNVLLLSEHYRATLGIRKDKFDGVMKIMARIIEPTGSISRYLFMEELSDAHPDVATQLSLRLGHIGLRVGCFGLALGVISLFLGVLSLIIA